MLVCRVDLFGTFTQMKEDQYRSLCEACDRALLAPDTSLARIAIPWLHVVRDHPEMLTQYADLIRPIEGLGGYLKYLAKSVRSRLRWYRQIFRAIRSDGSIWFGEKLPHGIDVLVISHLLNSSQAGQADDFYFDTLPKELVNRGNSVLIALIDHTVKSDTTLVNKWKGNAIPRVILSRTLDLMTEISLRNSLKQEAQQLKKLAATESDPLLNRVVLHAAKEALSGGSQDNLRLAKQISVLTAELKPKAIMITHEGHAFERVAFAAARSTIPTVNCIGYQHSVLFPLQHAIRRNLASEYNPDQILTAGTVSKKQLETEPDLMRTPISVLGSNRGARASEITPAVEKLSPNSRACLVLPEGIESECHLLFEFSLDCARACPDVQFIWRLHPIVSFAALSAKNRKLRRLPPNVMVSKGTFKEALDQSRWVLYRGTSAVIQAVLAGLRPIYVESEHELPIDPLSELESWRWKVTLVNDFTRLIREEQQLHENSSEKLLGKSCLRSAQEYCASLFTPFDYNILSKISSR